MGRKLVIAAALLALLCAASWGMVACRGRTMPLGPYAQPVDVRQYNGSSYDWVRNNITGTAITTGSYTETQNSALLTNYNHPGVMLTLDVDAVADTPRITLSVSALMYGNYEALYSASTGVTAAGVHSYQLYPGNLTAAQDVVEVGELAVPRAWRVTVTHMDTDTITYTVEYAYLQ